MNRGQVAIWIILAVVLVASLILFFLLQRFPDIVGPGESDRAFDFQSYLDECVQQSANEALNIMLPQGGLISPKNTIIYEGANVEYICKHLGSYDNCVHQHSALSEEMEEEIARYISPRVEECFAEIRSTNRLAKIEIGETGRIDVKLIPEKAIITIEKDISIEKQGERRNFDTLKIEVRTRAFNLARIAMEIGSQESKFGYFEYHGFNLLYRDYYVEYHAIYDGNEIYTIRDNKTGKFMRVAVRGSVNPHGI